MILRNIKKVGDLEDIREIEFNKDEIETSSLIDFISFEIKEENKKPILEHFIGLKEKCKRCKWLADSGVCKLNECALGNN